MWVKGGATCGRKPRPPSPMCTTTTTMTLTGSSRQMMTRESQSGVYRVSLQTICIISDIWENRWEKVSVWKPNHWNILPGDSFQICHRGEPSVHAEPLRCQPPTLVWLPFQEICEAGLHEWRYSTHHTFLDFIYYFKQMSLQERYTIHSSFSLPHLTHTLELSGRVVFML